MSRFKIPIVPTTTQRSIRFPNDLIDDIENIIQGKETTFTAFVVAASRHAIDELREENNLIKK